MAKIVGTRRSEVLQGTETRDNFELIGGNDTAYGGGENDTIVGSSGYDHLYGGVHHDVIYDNTRSDVYAQYIYDRDRIYGGAGNDIIASAVGHDIIYAGDGNDEIRVSASDPGRRFENRTSRYNGGDGHDTLSVFDPVNIKFTANLGAGNDLFFVVSLHGLRHMVSVDGGQGIDTFSLYPAFSREKPLTVRMLEDGTIKISGVKGTISGFERIDNSEVLFYSAVRFYGGAGDDLLSGSSSGDVLSGGAGQDVLEGYSGNDTLIAGNGGDLLHGYSGADTFVLRGLYGDDNAPTAGFSRAQGDKVRLQGSAKADLTTKTLADAFVLGTEAQDTGDRLIYDKATGRLYLDADGSGDGAQQLLLIVGAGAALSAVDFILL